MKKAAKTAERIAAFLLAVSILLVLVWCVPQFAGYRPLTDGNKVLYVKEGKLPDRNTETSYYYEDKEMVLGTLTKEANNTYAAEDGTIIGEKQVIGTVAFTVPYIGAFYRHFTPPRTVAVLLVLILVFGLLHGSGKDKKPQKEEEKKTQPAKEEKKPEMAAEEQKAPEEPKPEEKTAEEKPEKKEPSPAPVSAPAPAPAPVAPDEDDFFDLADGNETDPLKEDDQGSRKEKTKVREEDGKAREEKKEETGKTLLPEDEEESSLDMVDLDAQWGMDVTDDPHWADDVPDDTPEAVPGKEDSTDGKTEEKETSDDEEDYPEDPNPDDDFDI